MLLIGFFKHCLFVQQVSIVSGTMAERIKIWPFFLFCAILGGIIYPIQMGWEWGGGWLDTLLVFLILLAQH